MTAPITTTLRDIERRLAALQHDLADALREIDAPERVAPPAAAPAQPAAAMPPRPVVAAGREPLEPVAPWWDAIGARALALAGGAVTLLGIGLLYVFADRRGWVDDGARVAFGVV